MPSLDELADIAGQDRLAVPAERGKLLDEIAHRRAIADLLRVVGGEHDARSRDLDQRAFHRADGTAEAGGVEHDVVAQIMVEVPFGLHAVAGVVARTPELLVLIRADTAEQRRESAAEVRHVNDQVGVTVEHPRIDQPDRRHHQRELAADRARGVVAVELLGLIELERGVHEHEQSELRAFRPERLEFRRIEIEIGGLRGYHHARKAELVLAAGKLAKGFGAAERVGVRGADEAAGIVAFGLLGALVAQARSFQIGAHPGGAGQKRHVDAGLVHHPDMLVEVEQHPVHDEAGRAVLVVGYELAPAEVFRQQRLRGEMMLEIDDHRAFLRFALDQTRWLSRYDIELTQCPPDRDVERRAANRSDRGPELVAGDPVRLLPEIGDLGELARQRQERA